MAEIYIVLETTFAESENNISAARITRPVRATDDKGKADDFIKEKKRITKTKECWDKQRYPQWMIVSVQEL